VPILRPYKTSLLSDALSKALVELSVKDVGSEEYVKTLDQIVKLHKMMEEEKSSSVSRDTLITVGANLVGIILILTHEWTGPITSKALSLLIKPRV
jgi:hypothetical protein